MELVEPFLKVCQGAVDHDTGVVGCCGRRRFGVDLFWGGEVRVLFSDCLGALLEFPVLAEEGSARALKLSRQCLEMTATKPMRGQYPW